MMKSLFLLLMLPSLLMAQTDIQQQAGQKAAELLNNPAALEQYIQQHAKAQAADQQVRNLAGGSAANRDQIYQMASQVFTQLMQQYNGDPAAMMQAMARAQQNPEAFAASFSPEQKAQLKALAKDIESSRR